MSGIDQGMMPDYVQPQRPDDDTVDESVANPHDHSPEQTGDGPTTDDRARADEQAEVDDALAGISDDERADSERMARRESAQAADEAAGDTRSQR